MSYVPGKKYDPSVWFTYACKVGYAWGPTAFNNIVPNSLVNAPANKVDRMSEAVLSGLIFNDTPGGDYWRVVYSAEQLAEQAQAPGYVEIDENTWEEIPKTVIEWARWITEFKRFRMLAREMHYIIETVDERRVNLKKLAEIEVEDLPTALETVSMAADAASKEKFDRLVSIIYKRQQLHTVTSLLRAAVSSEMPWATELVRYAGTTFEGKRSIKKLVGKYEPHICDVIAGYMAWRYTDSGHDYWDELLATLSDERPNI